MRRPIVLISLIVFFVSSVVFLLVFLGPHIVLKLSSSFYPEVVYLQKDDSVLFINLTKKPTWPASGPHPTHTSYADFDPLQPIAPWRAWSFIFTHEGVYTFHDHLAPEVRGIVVVGDSDISRVTEQQTCERIENPQQQASCIEIYFKNIIETVDYTQARAIYEDIAPRYPGSCHNFAHDLGINLYAEYLNNSLPEIGQEASSCAYGLWHGFTTAMQNDRGSAASKEFCSSMPGVTDALTVINRMNCYHGIGIGMIPDPPDPHQWGNFNAVTKPALDFCDTVQGSPMYKERCLTGVFHAMTGYIVNDLYGFTLNKDLLTHCLPLPTQYHFTCLITLVSALPLYTDRNIEKTTEMIGELSLSEELFMHVFMNAAIMSVKPDAEPSQMGDFVSRCEKVDPTLRNICMQAVINNIYTNGTPGIEYQKAATFCLGSWIREDEKESCFFEVAAYSSRAYAPEKVAEVCDVTIPEPHRFNIDICRT